MNSKKYLWICAAAALMGCSDDHPDNQDKNGCNPPCADGQMCVNGTCQTNSPVIECNPPCSADQTCVDGTCISNTPAGECNPPCAGGQICVNGTCQTDSPVIECNPPCGEAEICVDGLCESVCRPACDPTRQKCDAASKSCLYIDNYCDPGTCAPDNPRRVCPSDGNEAGIWSECAEGESCFHGACLPEIPTECTAGTCNDVNQACIDGSWKQCSDAEKCVNGDCKIEISECAPGTCIQGDDSYFCNASGNPEKCADGEICIDGACADGSPKNTLLWSICSVNSDCSFGSCVKELKLSREIEDPDNPDIMLSAISVSQLDDRIPQGSGICTADCVNDASLCDYLSFGDKHFTCQLVYEGASPYPPKTIDGEDFTLPFVNELDAAEMTKRIPFAAMCRPFIKNNEYPEDFGKACGEDEPCTDGTKCIDGRCSAACAGDASCPLTFSCIEDTKLGKFCQPDKGTYTACRDRDKDGYGIGLCPRIPVDCDDSAPDTYYTTESPKNCSEKDTNCNGRIDMHELLGSSDHCTGCGAACKMPMSKYNMSRICYKNNGGRELDDYTPDTYAFECVKGCASGYADCDGDASNGCELNIIEASKTDSSIKIYSADTDKDGFGSDRDGTVVVSESTEYDKNQDDRVFCCKDKSKCYGYLTSPNPSVPEKQWSEIDVSDGYTVDRTDCNDADKSINTKAKEICDGIDNNCSGTVDELDNLYDAEGQKIDTDAACKTGKPGVCENGKLRCEKIQETYQVYCKSDHPSQEYEYCNGISDDCDEFIDEGVIAVDDAGKPVKDSKLGYRMLDPEQENYHQSADYICFVDDPDAKGKCRYGRYTCDPSRTKMGKDAVYCKPFAPDALDFIGDNYDANCDGFDGDLKHTLFVTGATEYIDGLNPADNDYLAKDIKKYSEINKIHLYPLITLKKAVEFAGNTEEFTITPSYYREHEDDMPLWYESQQKCASKHSVEQCRTLTSSWDIVVKSGDIDQQPADIPVSSAVSKVDNIIIPKVIVDDVLKKPVIKKEWMIPSKTQNTWFRIYGGGDRDPKFPGNYTWTMNTGVRSDLKFTLTEQMFYQPDGIIALFNMNTGTSDKAGGLYMANVNAEAKADFGVDAALAGMGSADPNSETSPATLIGVNAVNASALVLDNVRFDLKAPDGKSGETTFIAEITDDKGITSLSGAGGNLYFAKDTASDIYDLYYHYQKGYNLDSTTFKKDLQLPVCSNGEPIHPGGMGGYIRLDEYGEIKGHDNASISRDVKSRLFRNFFGMHQIIKADEYTETEPWQTYRHLQGYPNVSPDISIPRSTRTIDIEADYNNPDFKYPGPCTKGQYIDSYKTNKWCKEEGPYYLYRNDVTDYSHPTDIIHLADPKTGTPIPVNSMKVNLPSAAGPNSPAGLTDSEIMTLTKTDHGYRFLNHSKAIASDGKNGENGAGGAGMPVFIPPNALFGIKPLMYANPNAEDAYETILRMYENKQKYLAIYAVTGASDEYNNYFIQGSGLESSKFEYSMTNMMVGLYDTFMLYYIDQHHRTEMLENQIAYLTGASGGAGGCGGGGGQGGRPGASAVGIIFTPDVKSAAVNCDLQSASFYVTAGNGGRGSAGTSGTMGYNGGIAKNIELTKIPGAADGIEVKTLSARDGLGGSGGGGGSGAQGGYAMGIIIDCSAVNAHDYTQCKDKIQFRRPNLSAISTSYGKHGFAKGSTASQGMGATSMVPGAGGKPTSAPYVKQAPEIINNPALPDYEQVLTNQKISFIYDLKDNAAVLGRGEGM